MPFRRYRKVKKGSWKTRTWFSLRRKKNSSTDSTTWKWNLSNTKSIWKRNSILKTKSQKAGNRNMTGWHKNLNWLNWSFLTKNWASSHSKSLKTQSLKSTVITYSKKAVRSLTWSRTTGTSKTIMKCATPTLSKSPSLTRTQLRLSPRTINLWFKERTWVVIET